MLFCKGVCSAVDAEAAGLTATGGLSGAVCASPVPAKRPSRPHANIAVTAINVFTEDLFLLWNELLRDRKRPPKPKCPRCNLQPRRSLLTFVLVAIDMQRDILHQLKIEPVTIRNLLRALQILNIQLQDTIQYIVGRQAILILLVRPQLRRRGLVNSRLRNEFPIAINPFRQI